MGKFPGAGSGGEGCGTGLGSCCHHMTVPDSAFRVALFAFLSVCPGPGKCPSSLEAPEKKPFIFPEFRTYQTMRLDPVIIPYLLDKFVSLWVDSL